jgi:NAD+ diphosphatase
MNPLYIPWHREPAKRDEPALWFAFREGRLLVCSRGEHHELPLCLELDPGGLPHQRSLYLGRYAGNHCYGVEIGEARSLPEGWCAVGLREAFAMLEPGLAALAGRAWQLLDWDRNHQFCSRCGAPTQPREDERSRLCTACGRTSYPPVSPAVMVLITDGDARVLLARKSGWATGRYSALAGFVEPGETLEDTIARETREEVGVEVTERALLRQPALAVPPFAHDRLHGRIRRGRNTARRGGNRGCALVRCRRASAPSAGHQHLAPPHLDHRCGAFRTTAPPSALTKHEIVLIVSGLPRSPTARATSAPAHHDQSAHQAAQPRPARMARQPLAHAPQGRWARAPDRTGRDRRRYLQSDDLPQGDQRQPSLP